MSRFGEAQALLVLQRAHRGDGLELLVEGRPTHVRLRGEFVDADRCGELRLDVAEGLADPVGGAAGRRHLRDGRAVRAVEHAEVELAQHQRGEHGNVAWRVEQAGEAQHAVLHLAIEVADEKPARGVAAQAGRHAGLRDEVGDLPGVGVDGQAQVGRFGAGLDHLADQRQVHRHGEELRRDVAIDLVLQQHLLRALHDHADRRLVHRRQLRVQRGQLDAVQPRDGGGVDAVAVGVSVHQGADLALPGLE